jgi:hypothetical protein
MYVCRMHNENVFFFGGGGGGGVIYSQMMNSFFKMQRNQCFSIGKS